ncbi:MAG: hypothetical protein IPH48_17420 [bacterium]|nr:hypothetical protein [bacterium]
MGIQDNFWTIGEEAVAWGTKAATLTRGIENQTDDATPNIEHMQSRGMRPATVATPTGRSVAVPRGGQHVVTLDLMNKSLGLIFAGVASTVATTTPGGATNARLHTFTPTTSGPIKSFTLHAGRVSVDGTTNHHNYLGCMVESLNLALSPKGLPVIKTTYQYKELDTAGASVTPSYPTTPTMYTDTDCVVTIGGSSECLRSADFTLPTGLDMERWRICAGGREKPILNTRVEPTGTLSIDYDADTYLDAWVAGTELEDLVITFTGGEVETGQDYFFRATFPLIQLTGSSPKVGLDMTPEQPLPFRVLDNGTDPAWTLEYQNGDAAY